MMDPAVDNPGALGRLAGLGFSDLYLEPEDQAWFKLAPDDRERHVVSGALLEEAHELRRSLQDHRTGLDFRVDWDGLRLRVQRIETVNGDVYVCRRLLDHPMPFQELKFPQKLSDVLLGDDLGRGGLVLFTGPTGAGKSMSQASWIAARLARFGGTACTVENPVEVPLHGRHGSGGVVGTCYQTEVHDDAEFGPSIRRILRAAPNMMMIGEIRANDAAAQAVLAGSSGHLVSSTLHANDVLAALERLKTMLVETSLDVNFMADALAVVLHQTMITSRVGGESKRRVVVSPLVIAGAANETAIRSTIRKGDFSLLASEMRRQDQLCRSSEGGRL